MARTEVNTEAVVAESDEMAGEGGLGARRIAYELRLRGVAGAPGRTTVYQVVRPEHATFEAAGLFGGCRAGDCGEGVVEGGVAGWVVAPAGGDVAVGSDE